MDSSKAPVINLAQQRLKEMVWFRAFSSKTIIDEDHYYRAIAEEIIQLEIFPSFQRPGFHWQTVRNFFQERVKPTKKTLEILATYAMSRSSLISWRYFLDIMENEEGGTKPLAVEPLENGRWRIRVVVEVPVIIEIEELFK